MTPGFPHTPGGSRHRQDRTGGRISISGTYHGRRHHLAIGANYTTSL